MLPLDAFLLKPVQRVLKYSLLLYEMGKRTPIHSDNYEVVQVSGLGISSCLDKC